MMRDGAEIVSPDYRVGLLGFFAHPVAEALQPATESVVAPFVEHGLTGRP